MGKGVITKVMSHLSLFLVIREMKVLLLVRILGHSQEIEFHSVMPQFDVLIFTENLFGNDLVNDINDYIH